MNLTYILFDFHTYITHLYNYFFNEYFNDCIIVKKYLDNITLLKQNQIMDIMKNHEYNIIKYGIIKGLQIKQVGLFMDETHIGSFTSCACCQNIGFSNF